MDSKMPCASSRHHAVHQVLATLPMPGGGPAAAWSLARLGARHWQRHCHQAAGGLLALGPQLRHPACAHCRVSTCRTHAEHVHVPLQARTRRQLQAGQAREELPCAARGARPLVALRPHVLPPWPTSQPCSAWACGAAAALAAVAEPLRQGVAAQRRLAQSACLHAEMGELRDWELSGGASPAAGCCAGRQAPELAPVQATLAAASLEWGQLEGLQQGWGQAQGSHQRCRL